MVDMRIWRLPGADPDRPHGIYFRLYFGRAGDCEILYDTHTGKPSHRHVDGRQEPYKFSTVEALIEDFSADCAARGWKWS